MAQLLKFHRQREKGAHVTDLPGHDLPCESVSAVSQTSRTLLHERVQRELDSVCVPTHSFKLVKLTFEGLYPPQVDTL